MFKVEIIFTSKTHFILNQGSFTTSLFDFSSVSRTFFKIEMLTPQFEAKRHCHVLHRAGHRGFTIHGHNIYVLS